MKKDIVQGVKQKMIYEEILKKRELKHKQEDLLELIVELKKDCRAKIILLNNQIRSLNSVSDKVYDAKIEELDMYILKVNQMVKHLKINNIGTRLRKCLSLRNVYKWVKSLIGYGK